MRQHGNESRETNEMEDMFEPTNFGNNGTCAKCWADYGVNIETFLEIGNAPPSSEKNFSHEKVRV